MLKRFSRGWLVVCMLACINAYSVAQGRRTGNYASNTNYGELEAKDYDFEDFSVNTYLDGSNEPSSVESSERNGISSTTARSGNVLLPLVAEPDAEMLPAHYSGVEPPGVDHMEIRISDSASMGSSLTSVVANETMIGTSKIIPKERAKSQAVFEKSTNIDNEGENRKGEYAEAAGKKKTYHESEKIADGREDESSVQKSNDFKVQDHRGRGHDALGYHNVYHKDEYKKGVDFYDNDHESGRFRKHGHYDEKHVSTEVDFRKGDSRASDLTSVEAATRGNFERVRAVDESKGRTANFGNVGFFGKTEESGKQQTGAVTGPTVTKSGQNVAKVR